ncbi:hypothetical protein PIB30_055940 [Stylosanthes scabra]|uniref:MYND-type domain-containing protein n=1 Tax=Stylosanthes scabra TaxID=79078 RepID=A0ABU6XJJ3_9FABA|nr:hypothetical protein [Stylosanthes scabra]
MDVDAIGEHAEKLKAVQIGDDNDDDDVVDQDIVLEEYEDDDDEEEEEAVTLGFVEKPKNEWTLERQFFPSKAGGVPAWLDPVDIPSGRSSICDICGEPLQFLLQVYAPTKKETAFHRMLFIFMCRSMKCLLWDQHEQWKRHPEKPSRRVHEYMQSILLIFWHHSCFISISNLFDTLNKLLVHAALCNWCGTWKGDKLCSSCRQVRYCSEKHQVMSWRSGHKIACQQMKISSPIGESNKSGATSFESCKVGSKNVWPEFEIIIEHESEYNTDIPEDNALSNSLISKNKIDDTMNSLMDSFQGDDDKKSWVYFQERIAKAPEQVLRYYRDTNTKPIWPVSSGRPSNADIPKCSYCGGPRCCEFQEYMSLLIV